MRLVSLCPSTTELIFQLGAGDQLVGVTEWCIHPAAGVAAIPKVGGTKNPNIAQIAALAPDWVFLNEEENRLQDGESLRALGLRLHVSFPKTVGASIELIRSVGLAIGREASAEALAVQAETLAEQIRGLARTARPVRYAYLIWRKPWMAAGGDTYLNDLLALAGGVNVLADAPDRYPVIEPETLLEAAPEAVLLCSEPFPFQEKHIREWRAIEGFQEKCFLLADGEALTWHGSRTLSGMSYAWDLLQGVRSPRG